MEVFVHQTPNDLDSGLINEIVCKVKSEGLFDQFRRECLVDIDTKPAYQNLQHRVESTVGLFLDEQKWNSQMNKNQIREKLRKLITDKSFFEAGIERVIDQVVIPKLNTNFVPKIEDVAYKLLGIEKPSVNMKMELEIDADILLPIFELEQVSPESEKSHSYESKCKNTHQRSNYDDIPQENDEKNEDLESPAFEPIEHFSNQRISLEAKEVIENDDMDISDDDDDDDDGDDGDGGDDGDQRNGCVNSNIDEVKSNLSSISGLTSNDSKDSSFVNKKDAIGNGMIYEKVGKIRLTSEEITEKHVAPEITVDKVEGPPVTDKIFPNNLTFNLSQESVFSQDQLSQVSSSSRLSIVTNNNTNTQIGDLEIESNIAFVETFEKSSQQSLFSLYGISEEAQMQKFNESSSSGSSLEIGTGNNCPQFSEKKVLVTSFDINREEIKFEGTERKCYNTITNQTNKDKELCTRENVEGDLNMRQNFDIHMYQSSDANDKESNINTSVIETSHTFSSQSNHEEDINKKQKDKFHHRSYIFPTEGSKLKRYCVEDIDDKIKTKRNKYKELSKKDCEKSKNNPASESAKKSSGTFDEKKKIKNNKNSNKQKTRSETRRATCHKDKELSRQRSRSKDRDSKDGFGNPNLQFPFNCNESNIVHQNQSSVNSSNDGDYVSTSCSASECISTEIDTNQSILIKIPTNENHILKSSSDHEKQTITNSPVVIDQILTGNELDLKSFIGENRYDPVVSSIEESLKVKEKLPKVAANIFEAKRLIKIRKQIKLNKQKKLEQATVRAKQYIRSNSRTIKDDTQKGIELEFVCVENKKGRKVSGPIISSPVKYIYGKSLVPSTFTSGVLVSMREAERSSDKRTEFEDDKDIHSSNFVGFNESEVNLASACHKNFLSVNTNPVTFSTDKKMKYDGFLNTKQYHIIEKSQELIESGDIKKSYNRKRNDDNTILDVSSSIQDDEVILANVFISQTSRQCTYKSHSSGIEDQDSNKRTVEKQRQKTRYTNEDLFKPRPLLGGISRRRRGFNCND